MYFQTNLALGLTEFKKENAASQLKVLVYHFLTINPNSKWIIAAKFYIRTYTRTCTKGGGMGCLNPCPNHSSYQKRKGPFSSGSSYPPESEHIIVDGYTHIHKYRYTQRYLLTYSDLFYCSQTNPKLTKRGI